jgi:hypothetical protein
VKRVTKDFEEQLKTLRETLLSVRASHKEHISELEKTHSVAMSQLKEEEAKAWQSRMEQAKGELSAEHLKATLAAEKDADGQLGELRRQYARDIQRLEEGQAGKMGAVRAEYDSTISDLKRTLSEMRGAAEGNVRQLEGKLEQAQERIAQEVADRKAAVEGAHEETVAARRLAKTRLAQLGRVHASVVRPLVAFFTRSASASVAAAARSFAGAAQQAESLCESEAQASWLASATKSVLEVAARAEAADARLSELTTVLESERTVHRRELEERDEKESRLSGAAEQARLECTAIRGEMERTRSEWTAKLRDAEVRWQKEEERLEGEAGRVKRQAEERERALASQLQEAEQLVQSTVERMQREKQDELERAEVEHQAALQKKDAEIEKSHEEGCAEGQKVAARQAAQQHSRIAAEMESIKQRLESRLASAAAELESLQRKYEHEKEKHAKKLQSQREYADEVAQQVRVPPSQAIIHFYKSPLRNGQLYWRSIRAYVDILCHLLRSRRPRRKRNCRSRCRLNGPTVRR